VVRIGVRSRGEEETVELGEKRNLEWGGAFIVRIDSHDRPLEVAGDEIYSIRHRALLPQLATCSGDLIFWGRGMRTWGLDLNRKQHRFRSNDRK
jgi:hypothetical protein